MHFPSGDTGNKAISFVRREYIAILFLALVAASFTFHASRRMENFQECDSSVVYDALSRFPTASLSFTWSASVASSPFISEDIARSIIATVPARRLIDIYKNQHTGVRDDVLQNRLIRAITNLTPLSAVRFAYLSLLSQAHLPHFIESLFALPTATTYSAGAGLFYGLVSTPGMSYSVFMGRALLLTLFLFHAAAVLIFLIGRRLRFHPFAVLVGATAFLFSISLYSYAYHLGSTVWNIWSGALWLWFLARYLGKPDALRNISIITAILVFFNYLIVFYWLAFAAVWVMSKMRGIRILSVHGWKMLLREAIIFLRAEKHFLIAVGIVLVLFYPPGQGRGEVSYLRHIPSNIYYIVLNFIGFFNHRSWLNIVQFTVGFSLLAFSLVRLFRNTRRDTQGETSHFLKMLGYIFVIYLILVVFGIMPILPSRHALFIAPAVFILLMWGLDILTKFVRMPHPILLGAWVLLVAAGVVGLGMRTEAMRDKVSLIPVPPDAERIFTYPDCSFHVAYHDFKTSVPFEAIKPTTFALKEGSVYGYASQGQPLRSVLDSLRDGRQYPENNLEIDILSDFSSESDTCFLGYVSPFISRGPFPCGYGDRNSIYFSEFRVNKF